MLEQSEHEVPGNSWPGGSLQSSLGQVTWAKRVQLPHDTQDFHSSESPLLGIRVSCAQTGFLSGFRGHRGQPFASVQPSRQPPLSLAQDPAHAGGREHLPYGPRGQREAYLEATLTGGLSQPIADCQPNRPALSAWGKVTSNQAVICGQQTNTG